MAAFLPGITLNRRFFTQTVRPILDIAYPDLQYAAALIGPGSDTLGLDTPMSMDHDWGLHFSIFLKESDAGQADEIANLLSHQLPLTYSGFSISLPAAAQVRFLAEGRHLDGPVKHHVSVTTVGSFMRQQLGYDLAQPLRAVDWLTIPSHALGEVVAGEVYYDGTGELTALRDRLAWYPRDVWLYMLASGWQRIGQEEHLMPRAGFVRDELGSALIGSRLIRDVMRLCFLMERCYAPYAKWFGTAFMRLECASQVSPLLWQAQRASTWEQREKALSSAFETLARMHNSMNIGKKLPEVVSAFHDRPFQVIHGEKFAHALVEQITDPDMRQVACRTLIGGVDQWSDSTDLEQIDRERLHSLYE